MQLVFTADTHFDSAFGAENAAVRNGELIANFESICAYAKRIGAAAVLLGGDIFDTPHPSKETCAALSNIIRTYGTLKFIAVAGNHDPLYNTAFYGLVPENMFVFPAEVTAVKLGDINIYGASVKSSEDTRDPWQGVRCEGKSITLSHGMLDSSAAFSLDSRTLADTGASMSLLGHVHNTCEKLLSNGSTALYAGSPAGRGFDECGDRGFYVIDTDSFKYKYIKTDATVYREYKVDIGQTHNTDELMALLMNVKTADNEISRAVLTGSLLFPYSIDCRAICEFLPQFCEVKDVSEIDINITENIAENTLEGKFLRILASRLEKAEGEERQKILDAMKEGVLALRKE